MIGESELLLLVHQISDSETGGGCIIERNREMREKKEDLATAMERERDIP